MAEEYRPYPTPRTKQACENCRRKKAKCPGEKPRCSLCARLRQRCVYADDAGRPRTRKRRLEDGDVTSRIVNTPTSHSTNIGNINSSRIPEVTQTERLGYASSPVDDPQTDQSSSFTSHDSITDLELCLGRRIPKDVVRRSVDRYFEHFNNQPYPVLDHMKNHVPITSEDLPAVVLYPMLALTLRLEHALVEEAEVQPNITQVLIDSAWQLLNTALAKFEFGISFFQGLCLLAQVDFASGQTSRARAQVALGLNLAQSHGMLALGNESQCQDLATVKRGEVAWTLFIMDRIFNSSSVMCPSVQASSFQLPLLPGGPQHPISHSNKWMSMSLKELIEHKMPLECITISVLNIELVSIWEMVMAEISHDSTTAIPFWQDGSSRSRVLSRLLEIELNCGKHTYLTVGPPKNNLENPRFKDYYRTWFFMQLIHSTIYCCLNHPFIIYMKTIKINGRVPLTFLQKSYEYSMIYSNWVLRLINDMQQSDITLHDPFVGYMATIAATIQLEQTLNKNEALAGIAKLKCGKIRDFLKEMAKKWSIVSVMLGILDELAANLRQRRTINRVESEYDGSVPAEPTENVTVSAEDIAVMWKLFDYSEVSRELARKNAAFASSSDLIAVTEQMPMNHYGETSRLDTEGTQSVFVSNFTSIDDISGRPSHDLDTSCIFDLADFDAREHHDFGEDWMLMGRPWSEYFPGDS